jgi:glycosyl transferase, family 25
MLACGLALAQMNPFKNGIVDAVYVIHVAKFTDRAAHIRAELGRFEIPFEFVLPHDADDLDAGTLKRFLVPGGRLASRDLSLILKHMEAFRRLLAGGHQLALVLEDDVVLDKRFNQELSAIVEESRAFNGPFTIQIGCANNMFVPGHRLRPGQRLYEACEVRATDSFLINAAAARIRLDWLESHQFDRPVGHLFNQIDAEEKIKIYWSEPAIVEQGSMNGLFPTALGGGRKGKSLRYLKWRYAWQRLRKKYIYRFFR